jgi:predicted nucleic acid-binding protein
MSMKNYAKYCTSGAAALKGKRLSISYAEIAFMLGKSVLNSRDRLMLVEELWNQPNVVDVDWSAREMTVRVL